MGKLLNFVAFLITVTVPSLTTTALVVGGIESWLNNEYRVPLLDILHVFGPVILLTLFYWAVNRFYNRG